MRANYQDFPVQQTQLTEGPTLNTTLLHASLRAERRLTRWLKLYAQYDYERVLSNLPDIEYQVNAVGGGSNIGNFEVMVNISAPFLVHI